VSAASASVKADPAPQLRSVSVYWRGRKMVLMQRPQRRLSALLRRLLKRSRLVLSGTMARAIATAVMATAAMAARAGAPVTGGTLPTGAVVQAGQAVVSQSGSQMTVAQSTDKAIIDWQSFSIGSQAGVNFSQPGVNSVTLNRVVGNDPSQLLGSMTANGKVFLINAAGILVGAGAKIDVGGFVGSTLDISNADFLANKLNFSATAAAPAGVTVAKGAAITTPEGGNVYLIGSSVQNGGVITSPGGEVLLAAGSTVQLVDTGTPGVTVNVTGAEGNVTNLGQIVAAAGRIGIGAALIDNSGTLDASSVEKEGGRIFLRASKQLTTEATSQIDADGATGGYVVLYSDQQANIDGDVSALGSAGNGGYVETSGKTSLTVQYTPRVGPGGKWLVDPYDITIDTANAGTSTVGGVITSTGLSATILASTITDMLNAGTDVSIVTGAGGTGAGDITVNAAIVASTTNTATLTLDAANNISLNANITTPSSLILNAASGSITQTAGVLSVGSLTTTSSGGVTLSNAGNMISSYSGSNTGSGDIALNNGSVLSVGNVSNAAPNGNVTINNYDLLTTTGSISASGTVGLSSWGSLAVGGGITAQNINLTSTSRESIDDITLGGALVASNVITLNSAYGISQDPLNGGISAATLNASAVMGIDLSSPSGNHIGSFSAANTLFGDIAFTNTSTGISAANNTLTTGLVHNAGGNISIDNTGAMVTSDLIDAPAGTVTLQTHSPLTIGSSAMVSASGDINLSAGYTLAGVDDLTLNSLIASANGNVTLYAGSNIRANAGISAPNGVVVGQTVKGVMIAGPGYSVDSPTAPTYMVVPPPDGGAPAAPIVLAAPATSTVDQNVAATQTVAQGDIVTEIPAVSGAAATQANGSDADQTTGGAAGTFGGASDDDGTADGKNKAGVKLPVCT
jgi:filamentous hemagglutinin family protein